MKMKLSPKNLLRVFTLILSFPKSQTERHCVFLCLFIFCLIFPHLRNSYGFMCNFRYKVAPLPT